MKRLPKGTFASSTNISSISPTKPRIHEEIFFKGPSDQIDVPSIDFTAAQEVFYVLKDLKLDAGLVYARERAVLRNEKVVEYLNMAKRHVKQQDTRWQQFEAGFTEGTNTKAQEGSRR